MEDTNWLQRMKTMIIGAFTTTAQDDEKGIVNRVQIQRYFRNVGTSVYYPYGYYGSAPVGSQALTFSLESKPENLFSLLFDVNTRFKGLQPGEVMMGNQVKATFIKFTNDGGISIFSSATVKVNCVDADIECSNNASLSCVDSAVTCSGNSTLDCVDSTITCSGDSTITATGKADVNCNSSTVTVDNGNGTMKVDGFLEVTKDVQIDGSITTTGDFGTGDASIAGKLDADGNITSASDVSDSTRSMASDRSLYNSHTHTDPQGGSTGTPMPQQ